MPVQFKRGDSATALRITPLIDVMFMLVIFFLVTARFEEEERDMEVKLPSASEAQPTIFEGSEVFVTVTPEGDYYLDGEALDARSLERRLSEINLRNPGRQRVTIRADENSRTGRLVAVMNA
ncbi:MAG: biopolymer transporter ExbD, partial [Planctomycetota bacterium]